MNRDSLRKVVFRPFDTVTDGKISYFHQWANTIVQSENGQLSETVAIIEEEGAM